MNETRRYRLVEPNRSQLESIRPLLHPSGLEMLDRAIEACRESLRDTVLELVVRQGLVAE